MNSIQLKHTLIQYHKDQKQAEMKMPLMWWELGMYCWIGIMVLSLGIIGVASLMGNMAVNRQPKEPKSSCIVGRNPTIPQPDYIYVSTDYINAVSAKQSVNPL